MAGPGRARPVVEKERLGLARPARARKKNWPYVAHFVVIVNDVMNDNMAAFVHVGACLGAFFYWTRFFFRKQCLPFDNIHSNLSDQSAREISVRIRVRLRVALF